jgi:tetratricopeptide (TPR) repeat protein
MIRNWAMQNLSPGATCIVFWTVLLFQTCAGQVSGFSPHEHLASDTGQKNQEQLLSDLSAARQSLETHRSAEANLSVGRALKALGESQAASEYFNRALALNPRFSAALFEKGLIVTESGDWSKAADFFRKALADSPSFAAAHLALGEMLLRTGDFEGSRNELNRALQLDGNSAGAQHGLGLIDLQEGKVDLAVGDFRRAIAMRPDYMDAERGLARALALQHKWYEAAALLRHVTAANTNSSEDASALGTALSNLGDQAGAATEFARARDLSNEELTLLRAKGDNNWGISLRNEGKLEQAAAAFRHAIGDDPAFCDAHDDLGEVLWIEKQFPEALSEFQAALRCDPHSAMVQNNLGSALLYFSHDVEAAIGQFRACLASRPGFALAHLNLGKALAAKGAFAEAETELRNALAVDPISAGAHLNLGLVLAVKNGELSAEAKSELEKGIGLDPRLRDMVPQKYLAALH